MRKIMVFQHVGHEPLGTLDPLLKAAGFRIRYVNFGRHPDTVPSLDAYNGLVVLGGPMGVYDAPHLPHLQVELQLIEQALKKDIPILGICLGAQLIAHVLGGEVKKAPRWELGWNEIHVTDFAKADGLFKGYQSSEKIFQIHQDTFTIPSSVVHLARSSLCEGQAFRYQNKVYGLQFHLEVDQPMIRRWMSRPENRKIVDESEGLFSIDTIERETFDNIAHSLELSQNTFSKFIELFGLPERGILLESTSGKSSRRRG